MLLRHAIPPALCTRNWSLNSRDQQQVKRNEIVGHSDGNEPTVAGKCQILRVPDVVLIAVGNQNAKRFEWLASF